MKALSQMGRLAAMALPGLLLTACANYSSVPEMNAAEMSGGDFDRNLARNYKTFANYEAYEMEDWRDAVAYADKAKASAVGTPPEPDDLSARRFEDPARLAELQTARGRLMQSLAAGAAQKTPVTVARAQADFDCWAEQQEEGHQLDHIAACRDGFWQAMRSTETALIPASAPGPAAAQAAQPSSYRVFFDWDQSELTADTRRDIDKAIGQRASGQNIYLIGHTDSSGDDDYNMRLSQRRIDAVASYMVANGVPRSIIATEARGEEDQLVDTADNVREGRNRGVLIELFTRR